MSKHSPRFQIVRQSEADPETGNRTGRSLWHARFVAGNGQIVFTSETYERRGSALRAIASIRRGIDAPIEDFDGRV